MPRHYRKLRGNSAYYPFAARTGMRARQRREVRALRIAGTVLLGAAAALLLRQTVGRGGQPEAPVQPVPSPALVETAENARGSSITVQPVAATRDALASGSTGCPHPGGTACLPRPLRAEPRPHRMADHRRH